MKSKVNWISCEDIGKVAAHALRMSFEDKFRVLDITGPQENTFSAPEMQSMFTRLLGKDIEYCEVPVPDLESYRLLWSFLRNNGYNVCTNTVREITGDDPVNMQKWIENSGLFDGVCLKTPQDTVS